ncbi:MAG: TonB-dependent receptor [Pseudomonadota bacterium]
MRSLILSLFTLSTFYIPISFAEEANDMDMLMQNIYGDADQEFIAIATGVKQPTYIAPAVNTVINDFDIRNSGARTLDQLLERIPSLHVSMSSIRNSPIYSMRGISTDTNPHVLMLINGIPMTQINFGDRGLQSTLPISTIERVEVIRGPGSAVYGADAFAGVINIVTKNADTLSGTETGIRLGSFDTQDLWVMHGRKYEDWKFFFSLEGSHTNGDEDRIIERDAQTIFDTIFGTDVSLAPGPLDSRAERFDLRATIDYRDTWKLNIWSWQQNDLEVGPGLGQALDPEGYAETENKWVDISYNTSFANWNSITTLHHLDVDSQSRQTLFPAGTVLPIGENGNVNFADPVGLVEFTEGYIGNPEVYEEHYSIENVSTYDKIKNHFIRISSGFKYISLFPQETKNFGPGVLDGGTPPPEVDGTLTDVTGTENVFMQSENRDLTFISLQDEWQLPMSEGLWYLTSGIRFDNYSDFGSTINPRLALVWHTKHDLTSKLLYGSAFRPPSFTELFSINNPVVVGNPDLKAETIDTLELAFAYRPMQTLRQANFNFFYYEIDDAIRAISDTPGETAVTQNTDGQQGYGMEWDANWNFTKRFLLNANFSWINTNDKATGEKVANTPHFLTKLNPTFNFSDQWHAGFELFWIGQRYRNPNDPRKSPDDLFLTHLTVGHTNWINNLDISFNLRNIFNREMVEPSPYEPGIPGGAFVPGDYPIDSRAALVSFRLKID